MATEVKINHRDVIAYLVNCDPDMRELVLDLAKQEIAAHDAKRAAMSARLMKARKNIGKGRKAKAAEAATTQASEGNGPQAVQADPQVQQEVAEQLPVHQDQRGQRGRPRHSNQSLTPSQSDQVMTAAVE